MPYPPNYGGVIDVFYKIKSLHAIGIKIILHCFKYGKNGSNGGNGSSGGDISVKIAPYIHAQTKEALLKTCRIR